MPLNPPFDPADPQKWWHLGSPMPSTGAIGDSAWGEPTFGNALGQFPSTGSMQPPVPWIDASHGLLGGIPAAEPSSDVLSQLARYSFLGTFADPVQPTTSIPTGFDSADPQQWWHVGSRLPSTGAIGDSAWGQPTFGNAPGQFPSTGSMQPPVPWIDASRGLLGGIPAAQPMPDVPSQLAHHSFLGTFADPVQPTTSVSTGILPAKLGVLPLASATTATALAVGGSWPNSLKSPGTDSNPFTRLLNSLNPISPANAAEDEGGGLPPALALAIAQGLLDAATARRLIEQQKILQEAQDARRELFEVAQGKPSSRALGVSLEASGVARPEGYAAHHIVAGGALDAAVAQSVLKKFNIRINDAVNGVFLPANRATTVIGGETVHSTLHTAAYYNAVNKALRIATTRQQAVDILRDIGRALQSGDYP